MRNWLLLFSDDYYKSQVSLYTTYIYKKVFNVSVSF